MSALRELLLSMKVKVDKTAIKETDVAFDHASKSAQNFENGAYKALAPIKKIGEALTANVKKARELAQAILPEGALPSARPEAPSNRLAREARDAFGLSSHPTPPRPGQSLAAPDVSKFMAQPDTRSGPVKALASLRSAAQSALAEAGSFVDRFNARFDGTIAAIFNVRMAMAGLAVVVAGTAIGRFFNDVIEAGGALHDMAQRTRVSVESLQVWRSIAADAGVDAGAIEGAFRKLNKSMAAAARGAKLPAGAFSDLGVEIKNADGSLRPIEEVLIDTGSALAGLDDDAKATALATQLLGASGMGLVPAFNGGADAVRKLSAELRENVALNAEEAARLDDVGDALSRGVKKWTAIKARIAVVMLPVLEAVANGFEKVSKWVLRTVKDTAVLQTAFAALTGLGIARLVTMLGAWVVKAGGARAALALLGSGLRAGAMAAAQFAFPLLILEDFLTFLAGGKSVFGRAMNEIFGAGGADEKRQEFLAFFKTLGEAAGSLASAVGSVTNSALFKGAAKTALEAILSVLNAIGLMLSSNTEKADKLADSLQGHLSNLGLAPTKEHVEQLNKDALPEDLGGKKRAPEAPEGWGAKFARKAMVAVLGDPTQSPSHKAWEASRQAKIAQMRADRANHPGGMIGPPEPSPIVAPSAPPTPKSIILTDNRKIEVNVGPNATPGATARAVAGAVSVDLAKDRRQVVQAL